MANLFDGGIDIRLDDRYDKDYTVLTSPKDLALSDIYFMCLILGYKNTQAVASTNTNGKEFRASYFSSLQRDLIYGFVLNLQDVKPEDLTDAEKTMTIYHKLTAYANGGIQWLRDHVFTGMLDENGAIDADPDVVIAQLNGMLHDELDPSAAPF